MVKYTVAASDNYRAKKVHSAPSGECNSKAIDQLLHQHLNTYFQHSNPWVLPYEYYDEWFGLDDGE